FLSLLSLPPEYKGRVLNVHPSLIPAFSGEGYYGSRVHKAVLDYGVKFSGCTVHFPAEAYDNRPIVFQPLGPLPDNETVETLASRVFQEECRALPEAIALYAQGRLRIAGRRVRIAP